MSKRISSLSSGLLIILILGAALTLHIEAAAYQDVSDDITALVAGNTDFAFDLYQALAAENDDNLIFSPYSISVALAMLYAGAEGETAAQMAEVLHFDLPPDQLHPAFGALHAILQPVDPDIPTPTPSPEGQPFDMTPSDLTLQIANGLWAQRDYPVDESYLDTLSQNYDSDVQTVDFSRPEDAREIIRQWIEDQTGGRITNMPPPGSIVPDTVLALVNAIYFSAEWHFPFRDGATADRSFTLSDGSTVTVPMMLRGEGDFQCTVGDGFAAISLDYGQSGEAGMLVVVPDAGRFSDVEAQLETVSFQSMLDALESTNTIDFYMPRFDFATRLELGDVLFNMGMTDAFGPAANFSGIGPSGLSVGYVGHSATITVDEQGTEATGVTVVMIPLSLQGQFAACQTDIIADRPFIFAIYEARTRSILFLGRVMNPVA